LPVVLREARVGTVIAGMKCCQVGTNAPILEVAPGAVAALTW